MTPQMTPQTIQVLDKSFQPYIVEATIIERIQVICQSINQDYKDKKPLFLAILNGSFMFASDIMKNITIPSEISFVKIASYAGLHSTGKNNMLIGLNQNLKGRHIVIVEDIVDSGKTMEQLLPMLEQEEPASIAICTLLRKPDALQVELKIDYIGFDIPNKFVIGYGLDYNNYGRNLRHLYQLIE